MTNHLAMARAALLAPASITEQSLATVLGTILGHAVDHADLYFQALHHESWFLEDGIIKEGGHAIDRGVGVRAMSGEKVGFAYSDDILLPAIEQAALAARNIARSGGNQVVKAAYPQRSHELYTQDNPLVSLHENAKVTLLQRLDQVARAEDPRVKQVMASLSGTYETIMTLNSAGVLAADVRPLVRVNVSVIVEAHGRKERATAGGGGRMTYEGLIAEDKAIQFAKEAVRQALVNLEAIEAPAGSYPVILGPGWPGVLLHEAVGHGLEGDFNRKGTSAFTGRIGEQVASPLCTVVDNGTLPGRHGSLNIDDEGTPTQETLLIEKGILRGYMQDSLNARLMGVASTGNGRRESYAHTPMPRMTNTYLLAGESDPQELIASVEKGIYAVNFDGGQVDITSGKFVFSASEAYLIEKGKITAPLKGVTLIGNGPEVMMRVSMVGNDLKLDAGVGVCGKEGQNIPVGVGQPTLKIDHITVGGTQG